MTNTFKKSFLFLLACLLATNLWAEDVTFTMSSIFDGSNLSVNVTTPVAATVSTNASKSNAKDGKLGSDGHYFQIVLQSNTFTAASFNGFINTSSTDKNWAFQFSTDGGNSWSEEKTQPNDGTKSAHDIAVNVNIPSGANGFRVIRRAGTSTVVSSITLTLGSGGGDNPTPGGGDDPTPGGGDDPTPGGGDDPTPGGGDTPTPSGNAFAHWRFSGSDAPAKNSSESGTNINVEFLTSDDSKSFSVESAAYNTAVPDDMKSQGTKGVKMGANALYLKVTPASGKFLKDDVVTICGYNSWKVSSTAEQSGDIAASVTTGTSKTDYNIGSCTLTADADALYLMRATSSGTCIVAIKVTRSGGDTPPADPVKVESVSLDKTSIEIEVGKTAQLTATVSPDNATDKSLTWTSDKTNIATVSTSGVVSAKAEGTATITVTTKDGNKTATCQVTVKPSTTPIVAVTGVSLDKTSATLEVGGNLQLNAIVAPADATNKTVSWTSDKTNVASVDQNGKITAVAEGTAKITVTTADGDFKAECNVTVNKKSTPVPQTDLTLHVPEIYEAKGIEGGYDGSLTTFNNREYEVYYVCRDASGSNISIATEPMDKTDGLTTGTDKTVQAKDGWFKLSGSNGKGGDSNAAAKDEFTSSSIQCVKMQNGHEFTFHVQGFDQFSFYGKDNNKDASKGRYFEVYIDNQKVSEAPVDGYAIHRYDMSTSEHVIRLVGLGGSDSKLTGFSFRVAEEPRTKYFKGNDTTQVILQTQAPLPVYYITKYYKKGLPEILWEGNAAEGISLKQKAQSDLRDTSYISGVANCPVGEYKYYIVTKMNGVETSRSRQGKFSVIRKVEFKNKRDTFCFVNQETAITPIVIRYYSNDDEAISLEWTSATQPAESEISVKQDKDANTLTISGTPTKPADYSYVVRLTDAEPIKGIIRVKSNKPTSVDGADKTMLFLTRTEDEQPTGMGSYLDTKYNYLHRAAASKTGSVDSYKAYNFVVISENVDADNAEALALIRGEVNIPVLNMKAFTYAPERVSKDGWGEPDNGTLKKEDGVYITVQRDDHPVFKALGKKQGDKIQVLDSINQKGLMPININNCDGSLALATAYPRDINNYYESAAYPQTIIHEIPAGSALRNGNSNKYICFPVATSSSNILTADGKKLLSQIIEYLTTAGQTAISTPELKITSFSIDGVAAKIGEDQIVLELDTVAHKIDLAKAKPAIQVASPYTHAEPLDGEEVNFKNSVWAPVVYTVTDYINRRTYDVIVRAYNPQGIEETYISGEWVNIYDIYGRLITTTNEDIYQIDLPRGMYIVVTANGGTLKIMK